MLNIEKYKDTILNSGVSDITCCVNGLSNRDCNKIECEVCKQHAMEWLLEEAKEPILDEVERKYLSEIIKPFKIYVIGITKIKDDYEKGKQYIRITVKKYTHEYINLSYFEGNTMYKGMKENKKYSLEELDL